MAVLRMERITMFLEAHFGDVQLRVPEEAKPEVVEGEQDVVPEEESPAIVITLDDSHAEIGLLDMVCVIRRTLPCNTLRLADYVLLSCFRRCEAPMMP